MLYMYLNNTENGNVGNISFSIENKTYGQLFENNKMTTG